MISDMTAFLQTAVQDTLNEEEGSQPVFHPRQNSFEASDEEDSGPSRNAINQNQESINGDITGTPTITTVAQRPNQVDCVQYSCRYIHH